MQLSQLIARCNELQAYPETGLLATQLYSHLSVLQQSFTQAGAQLHSRQVFLQVWLKQQEYKRTTGRLAVDADTFPLPWVCCSILQLWVSCSPSLLYSRLDLVLTAWMCSQNTTNTVGWIFMSLWGFIFLSFHLSLILLHLSEWFGSFVNNPSLIGLFTGKIALNPQRMLYTLLRPFLLMNPNSTGPQRISSS